MSTDWQSLGLVDKLLVELQEAEWKKEVILNNNKILLTYLNKKFGAVSATCNLQPYGRSTSSRNFEN